MGSSSSKDELKLGDAANKDGLLEKGEQPREAASGSTAIPAANGSRTFSDLSQLIFTFVGFVGGNIGLSLFNAWALSSKKQPHFNFPIFYTMFHMFVGAVTAFILLNTCNPPKDGRLPSLAQFWENKYTLLCLGACTVLSVGLNNVSLTMVSLFVNQAIRACSPLPTCLLSWLFAKQRFTIQVIATAFVIVGGCIMANIHTLQQSKPKESTQMAVGLVLCIISLLANSLKPVVSMIALQAGVLKDRVPLHPTSVFFYDSCISFVVMLIYWLASDERVGSTQYLSARPGIGVAIIIAGSVMAFIFNLSSYFYIKITSALSVTIGGNGCKIVLIIISAAEASVKDAVSWVGIAIVIVSIGAYAYFSNEQKKAEIAAANAEAAGVTVDKAETAAATEDGTKGAGPAEETERPRAKAPTEETPLVQRNS